MILKFIRNIQRLDNEVTPVAVLRMYRIACNLTGRYKLACANYVTFFGLGAGDAVARLRSRESRPQRRYSLVE